MIASDKLGQLRVNLLAHTALVIMKDFVLMLYSSLWVPYAHDLDMQVFGRALTELMDDPVFEGRLRDNYELITKAAKIYY